MPNRVVQRQEVPFHLLRQRSCLSRVIALLLFIIALAIAAQTPAEESALFVTIHLPHGVSVEVPRSWRIIAGEAKEALETAVAEDIDLSRMPVPDRNVLLRANATPTDRPASVSVAFFPRATPTLQQGEELSPSELTAYDQELHRKVENALRSQGGS